MKKIIVNVIIALVSLAALYTLAFGDWAVIRQMNGWIWWDMTILAFAAFGISSGTIVSYLDPENEEV